MLHQQAACGELMMRRKEEEEEEEETYTACCPERSFSPTSGRALTQPSRCIMGDQREADAGHREGKQAPEGGGTVGRAGFLSRRPRHSLWRLNRSPSSRRGLGAVERWVGGRGI